MSALADLPRVTEADVYKAGTLAGRLRRLPDRTEFAYVDEYLRGDHPPVATTLPRSTDTVVAPAGSVPPFFAGLLPEGRRLSALWRAVKTSSDDELSVLLAVGADLVGDVQVTPARVGPETLEPMVKVDRWEDVSFAEMFRRSLGVDVDRVGIPGVQDKVSAAMVALPIARHGDRFMLKLDPPEFPHLVENEAFFIGAARTAGLAVVDASVVHDAGGAAGLLVRRFDRVLVDGRPTALAVEDGCQVLGRYPADKYALTTEEVTAGLVAVTQARPAAARELLLQMAFAYLTCNGDAHAKNFAVLQSLDGEWRASPAYDLPSSHPYGDTTMALTVGGKRQEDIGRDEFVELGRAVGLPERAVTRALDDLVAVSDAWIDRLDDLPFDGRRLHQLRRAVTYRRDRLR